MLLSAVVDPAAFDESCFLIPGYKEHANFLLRAIRSNVVLLIDPNCQLKTKLISKVQGLPVRHGQSLQIQLVELLKQGNRRFVCCKPCDCSHSGDIDLLRVASQISDRCRVDGLVVGTQTKESLAASGYSGNSIVYLKDYSDSDFERLRHRFMEQLPPLDMLVIGEAGEIVSRPLRFTKWIRFYDKQIGSGSNTSHFRKGIEYVLGKWRAEGYFASDPGGVVEIITVEADPVRSGDDSHVQGQKRERNKVAYEKIKSELVDRIRSKYPWDIKLYVKQDLNGIFHARHLQTQSSIILFERGFDLFKPGGDLKRNILKVDNGSADHLSQCSSLQEASF